MFLHVFEIRYRLLIQRALARHDRTFGMMGRMTNYGCQVEILQCRELHDGRFFVEIKGTSMFHIKDKRERDGYWEASVEPLLENENTNTNDNVEDEDDWKELAHQTIQLYQKWEELVITNQWEQQKGQMQDIKTRLGPIPTVDEPLRLALWIAAAINPMPGLGVAREIRLAVVAASSHKERLELLRDTLNLSIDKTVSKKQRYDIRILFFLLLAGYFLVHRYWGRILYFLSQMPFLEEALLGVFRFVPNMHGDSNGEMGKLEAVIAGGEL